MKALFLLSTTSYYTYLYLYIYNYISIYHNVQALSFFGSGVGDAFS